MDIVHSLGPEGEAPGLLAATVRKQRMMAVGP